MTVSPILAEKLETLARSTILLVACDYDGTLAPIVEEPSSAHPHREAIVALRTLASLPHTHVAVISGRALADLPKLASFGDAIHLIGSHGSEFDPDFLGSLPEAKRELRAVLLQEVRSRVDGTPGILLEEKPTGVAVHFRQAPETDAQGLVSALQEQFGGQPGVFVRHGKKVMELAVLSTNKGDALETVRHRLGATATLFLGDDVTDEDAFATLRGPDLGIKVGEGPTQAALRVDDPPAVAQVLAQLSELRRGWLEGSAAVPIEEHSLLSDQRTVALVSPAGRLVWFCAPSLDSPALFAELLGDSAAGYFTIAPAQGERHPTQRYLGDSFVLETQWDGMRLTDFLDCSGQRPQQRPGRSDLLRVIEGRGRVALEFAPRLDFGRSATHLRLVDEGLEVEHAFDPIVLRSPGVEWRIEVEGRHHTARAEVELSGAPLVLELRYGMGSVRPALSGDLERRDATRRYWRDWAESLRLPPWSHGLVRRSALVLKALCHGPTGAIAAAATTSLPEQIGGVRNWDYRYCWLRDAAMAAAALVRLGSLNEAMQLLDWVLGVVEECVSPERLHPVYLLNGRELPAEAEIAELPGYRGSRPVRVGNAAAMQVQLDVFGPIVELVYLLLERDAPLSSEHWRLVTAMVSAVERRWREPDHGIWEVRTERRQHVHSKVMCWLTIDRALRIAEEFRGMGRTDWRELRDTIAHDVLEHGWDEAAGAFTHAFGSTDVDAAVLQLGLKGLLPPDDSRFLRTVEAVERELRLGPTVYRYHYDDGLPGFEGGFHICASWLIQAYLKVGRRPAAEELMRRMCELAGPTGLLSEQYGARTRRALGNHPQAFSHIGIIEAALALSGWD